MTQMMYALIGFALVGYIWIHVKMQLTHCKYFCVIFFVWREYNWILIFCFCFQSSGLLGALFIWINIQMQQFRKVYVQGPTRRILEVSIWSIRRLLYVFFFPVTNTFDLYGGFYFVVCSTFFRWTQCFMLYSVIFWVFSMRLIIFF